MIYWPAIIKHDNEDELIFIANEQQWQTDEEMLLYLFTERDVLIDSKGAVYSLPDIQQSPETAKPLGHATVENMLELVREHAVITNHCCASKIHASSIEQAIALVSSMSD